jgi:hypothetical protein
MLDRMLALPDGAFTTVPRRAALSELATTLRSHDATAVCLASVAPTRLSTTAQLVKRLRSVAPALKIVVGRWTPDGLSDGDVALLREAGADAVAATLAESRTQLLALLPGSAEGPAGRMPAVP